MAATPTRGLRDLTQRLTAEDERWLRDQVDEAARPPRFRPSFYEGTHPLDWAALCQRLVRDNDLPVIGDDLQAELLCVAAAAGIIEPSEPVLETMRAKGVRPPDDEGLVPAPIPWTLRGVLSSPVTISLDSPVLHVFLVSDARSKTTREILVVGRGAGEVRRRVYEAAWVAALASPGLPPGAVQELDRAAQAARGAGRDDEADRLEALRWQAIRDYRPAEVLDGLVRLRRDAVDMRSGVYLSDTRYLPDLEDPFTLFEQELRTLANTSSLVELHEVKQEDVNELRPKGKRPPDGIHRDRRADPNRSLIASVGDVLDEFDTRVDFDVPPRVLAGRLFQDLFNVVLRARAERTRADAEDRLRFHKRTLREYQSQQEEYRSLPPNIKKEWDREQHRLDVHVDHEMAVRYVLREPEFKSGSVYYNESLPSLMKSARAWTERMRRICGNIDAAIRDGRLLRLVLNHLFDRALRDLPPLPGDPEWPGMTQWQQSARPLLLRRWEEALHGREVQSPEAYCTRRLFFLADWDRQAEEGERGGGAGGAGATIQISANYLFVNTTSVIDTRPPVQRLVDRLDRIKEVEPGGLVGGDTGQAAGFLQQALSGNLGGEAAANSFRMAFLADPVGSAARVASHFLGLRRADPPGQQRPNPLYARDLLNSLAGLLDIGAYHACLRELVEFVDKAIIEPPDPLFQAEENRLPEVLADFILLCGRVDPSPQPAWDLFESWVNEPGAAGVPERVRQAIEKADEWEPGYLQRCLGAGEKDRRVRPSNMMRQLRKRRDGPAAARPLLKSARAAIDAALAIEAARQFPPRRMHARAMYRHLGDALAKVMAHPKGGFYSHQVQEVSDRLLGAEHCLGPDRGMQDQEDSAQ